MTAHLVVTRSNLEVAMARPPRLAIRQGATAPERVGTLATTRPLQRLQRVLL